MKILSYRVDDHDSNFCYFDGKQVRYYHPERNHGIKHYGYFPSGDLVKTDEYVPEEVFDHFGIDHLDCIVEVPDDPNMKGINSDESFFPDPSIVSIRTDNNIFNLDVPTFAIEHHWAHANCIWPTSDDVEYSIVYDGVGSDRIHASIFHRNERIAILSRKDCASVCLEFQSIAFSCGITAASGLDLAGKVMGFQSFGNPQKAKEIFNILYANYVMETSPYGESIWDHTKDNYEPEDIAMAYQMWVEHSFIDWVKKYVPTDATVSFSGGLAQNVLLNYKLSKEYKNLVIPPHVNDVGLSIGALGALSKIIEMPTLKMESFPFCQSDELPTETPTKETIATIAKELANGKIVAMYQGNGEVGPRALGNRSILMDPTIKNGKDIINERVKKREHYRPFGAAVMLEHVSDWFDWEGETPYMLHAVPVRDKSIESVTHVDGTCRIQTVKDGMLYDLLKEFYSITNVPVLLNTSLNLAGKPIAGTISEARQLFDDVDIDILCYGDTILYK